MHVCVLQFYYYESIFSINAYLYYFHSSINMDLISLIKNIKEPLTTKNRTPVLQAAEDNSGRGYLRGKVE